MRVRAAVVCLLLLAAFPFHAAAQSTLPALFSDANGKAATHRQPMSYDVTIEQGADTLSYTVNPGATGAARVTAVSPAENKLDQQGRAAVQRTRSAESDIWCASRYLRGAKDVALVREDEASAVYSFTPSAEQLGGGQNTPMFKNVQSEVTVLKADADVSEIRMFSTRPFSASIMHIDKFSVSIHCEPAENGRRFAAETVSEFAGSALFKHFNFRSVQRVSNLRLAD